VCHTVALPFYIKKKGYLKAKEEEEEEFMETQI
jgi:hypothetical protein